MGAWSVYARIAGGHAGQGGFTKRGVVWVSDIEGYVYERVKELTKGGQKPLVAKPKLIENLPILEVRQGRSGHTGKANPLRPI